MLTVKMQWSDRELGARDDKIASQNKRREKGDFVAFVKASGPLS